VAAKKQKYYVVWQGHQPGIYTSWDKASQQVKNFPNAVYKSFASKEEAEDAYRHGFTRPTRKPVIPKEPKHHHVLAYDPNSISVDAACSGNPGVMEYRGVWTSDSAEIFHVGPLPEGTNNIGEFLALVHALALLEKRGDAKTVIYSDSKTAMAWLNRKKANTKLTPSARNKDLFAMITRAEKWLREHTWTNPVRKWETEYWGEIPADFGRK
jgi:ribonuclease HI